MTAETAIQAALAAIETAHAGDPELVPGPDGPMPAEARYCARVSAWVEQHSGTPSPALRLAAAAQHLERWTLPRSEFPAGRTGYLSWRRTVHVRQGERARELVLTAGVNEDIAQRCMQLIAKQTKPSDPEGQALEDATCLAFLELDAAAFAASRPAADVISILVKTLRKMSARGRVLAEQAVLPNPVTAALQQAMQRLETETR